MYIIRYYKLPSQKVYPSVTTILGYQKSEGFGLRRWKSNNYNWKDLLQYSAVRGTMVHNGSAEKLEKLGARSNSELEVISSNRIQEVCRRANKTITEFFEEVSTGMLFFDMFLQEHKIDPIMSETVVYSDKYRFAGQLDQVVWLDGELTIIDIKTSKAVYKDSGYDMQLSAYALALAERTGNKQYLDCRRCVLLLSPDIEATNRLTYKLVDLPDATMPFLAKLEAYHRVQHDMRKVQYKHVKLTLI